MSWFLAACLLIMFLINHNVLSSDIEALKTQLAKIKKDYEDFKNSDPEQKRLKLNFERQFNNIKSINVNIKELVDALNYAKKKQGRLDIVTDYNTHIIQIVGRGFNTTIQGK